MIIKPQNQYHSTIPILLTLILYTTSTNNCPYAHFTNQAGQCIECLTTCSQCKDITTQCSSCSQAQFLQKQPPICTNCPLGQLTCNLPIIQCSPHYKLINQKCSPICQVKNCQTCTNIYTNSCSLCQQGYLLHQASNLCTFNNRNLQVENFQSNILPNAINQTNLQNQSNQNTPITSETNNTQTNQNTNTSNNQNQQDINTIAPTPSNQPTPNQTQPQEFTSFPNTNSEFSSFPNPDLNFNSDPSFQTTNQPINQTITQTLSTNQPINQLQPSDIPIIQPNNIPIIQPTDIPPLTLQSNQTLPQNNNQIDLGIDSESSININSNGNSSIIDLNNIQQNNQNQSTNTNNTNPNISITNNSTNINNSNFILPQIPSNTSIPLNNQTNISPNTTNTSTQQNTSTNVQEQNQNTTNPTPPVQNKTITNDSVNKTEDQTQIPFNSNSNTDTLENNGTSSNGTSSNGTSLNGTTINSSSQCDIGFYFDSSKNQCLPCYSKCRTCYKNPDQCLECAQGWQKQGWKCVTNQLLFYNLTLTPNKTQTTVESYINQFKNAFLNNLLPQNYQNQNSSVLTLNSANYFPQNNTLNFKGFINKLTTLNLTNLQNNVNQKFQSLSKIGSFSVNNYSLSSSRVIAGQQENQNQGRNRNNSNSNLASILIPSIIGGLIVLVFFSILLCYCCKICCFKQAKPERKTYNAAPVAGTQRHFVQKNYASGAPDRQNYQPQVSGAQPSSSLSKHTSALSDKITVIQFQMVPQKKQSVVKNIYESNLEDQITSHIKN